MKILYIWHGAVEKAYRKIFAAMTKQGHEIHLITAHRWTEASRDQRCTTHEENGYKIYPLRVAFRNHIRSFFFLSIGKMIHLLKTLRPEVVYIKEEPYSLACFQTVSLIRLFSPQSKVIVESDENMNTHHPWLYRQTERFVFQHIHGIASVPTAGIDLYKQKGFCGKQWKTSYFVDTEIFHQVDKEKAERVFPEINHPALRIGYVGRITAEKGLDTALAALQHLLDQGNEAHLYILGKMAEEYASQFSLLLRSPSLQSHVHVLSPRPVEDLVFFYNAIDVLVLPSRSTSWWIEQFGRVIVEAMACGTPVIGSSSGEIPYVIGKSDWIFPEGDVDKLLDIFLQFAQGKWKKDNIATEVIERIQKNFSIPAVASQKLSLMQEILSQKEK